MNDVICLSDQLKLQLIARFIPQRTSLALHEDIAVVVLVVIVVIVFIVVIVTFCHVIGHDTHVN